MMPEMGEAARREPAAQRRRLDLWRIEPYDRTMLPGMADLWVVAWTAAMPDIDFAARRGWLIEHITQLASAGVAVRVLFDDKAGEIAGFVTFEAERDWLDQLVVGVDHQGRGAAGALLDAARALSSGVVRLDVNAENARARAFYAREGFVETGRGINATSGRPTIQMEWRTP